MYFIANAEFSTQEGTSLPHQEGNLPKMPKGQGTLQAAMVQNRNVQSKLCKRQYLKNNVAYIYYSLLITTVFHSTLSLSHEKIKERVTLTAIVIYYLDSYPECKPLNCENSFSM